MKQTIAGIALLLLVGWLWLLRLPLPPTDLVQWQDSRSGLLAADVHPLRLGSSLLRDRVLPGDRLTRIDYTPVYGAADVQLLVQGLPAGTVLLYELRDATGATRQSFVRTSPTLGFGYANGRLWETGAWFSGLQAAMALLVLLILLPLIRVHPRQHLALLALTAAGLLIHLVWLGRYMVLTLSGSLAALRWDWLFALLLGGLWWLYLVAALAHRPLGWRRLLLVAIAACMPLAQAAQSAGFRLPGAENWMAAGHFLAIAPLLEASLARLQFGKVSLVITRALGYAVVFVGGTGLFLAVFLVLEKILPANPYRPVLTGMIFLLLALLIRGVYRAQEHRISRYFTSAQAERASRLQQFVAHVPQYTDEIRLREDLIQALQAYLGTPLVMLAPAADWQAVFDSLAQAQGYWAADAALAQTSLPPVWDSRLRTEGMALAIPLQTSEKPGFLLLIGRRTGRGVYNLSDLEAIQEVVRQTRLTLNVLNLIGARQELLRQTYEANLTALRAQINPHFLFNTLNTISALIHDAPDQAEAATEKLAFIFRYTLNRSSQEFVPLADELSLVRTYLEIEQIRFGKRLTVFFDIQPETSRIPVPAFMVQTFVENTIKHGISKRTAGGEVRISSRLEAGDKGENWLRCTVEDNGPGIDMEKVRTSTGLRNCLDRVQSLYQRQELLTFERLEPGTRVTLRVPAESDPKKNAPS